MVKDMTARTVKTRAQSMALRQGGVIDRAQLQELGISRNVIRREIAAGRWTRAGSESVTMQGCPLSPPAYWRVALAHSSPTAALDGVTALQAAGLTGFSEAKVHISVPKGGRVCRMYFVEGHELRCAESSEVIAGDLRRVEPVVATARGGLWMSTPKAAATVMSMAVQQRLVRPDHLGVSVANLPNHRRRSLLLSVVDDLLKGAQALSELEFGELCRRYRLPEPSLQRVLQRHNDLALTGDIVLRIPLLGLRAAPDEFMAQVVTALRSQGWRG